MAMRPSCCGAICRPGSGAATIARLYRQRWRIEGMFHRLESVLNSEIKTLGHPLARLCRGGAGLQRARVAQAAPRNGEPACA